MPITTKTIIESIQCDMCNKTYWHTGDNYVGDVQPISILSLKEDSIGTSYQQPCNLYFCTECQNDIYNYIQTRKNELNPNFCAECECDGYCTYTATQVQGRGCCEFRPKDDN